MTDVSNWTTSDVTYVQDSTPGTVGHQLNWQNVIQNSSVPNATNTAYLQDWEASADHVIGHLFMWDAEWSLFLRFFTAVVLLFRSSNSSI